jgi:Beta-lactamase enzyme family
VLPATSRPVVSDPQEALAAALGPILAHHTGDFAVGVIDRTTGARAFYHSAELFHTASIVKVDVLAALLLRHQHTGTDLSSYEVELAEQMIEESNNDAANDLWGDDGASYGMSVANATLGLTHTTPGADYYWGLTTTTVSDQLRLLEDLTSARSPLDAASRSFELGLMKDVTPDQAWGVSAAATPGTSFAVKEGWLPDPQLWVINSIGVIEHGNHRLLVAVLSKDQPSKAVGIAQVEAVAVAAVDAVTGTP